MGSHYNRAPMTKDKVLATATPAQTVIVQAGESIQDAIDSITDATSEKTYLVLVYPGVSRSYIPKDNVNVVFLEDMGGGGTPDDGSVTAAKLADALGAQLFGAPSITANSPTPGGTTANVVIQFRDIKGNNVTKHCIARVWISDTAGGDPTMQSPSGSEAVAKGFRLQTITAKIHWIWKSHSDGIIQFAIVNNTFPRTYYVNVEIGGQVYSRGPIQFINILPPDPL